MIGLVVTCILYTYMYAGCAVRRKYCFHRRLSVCLSVRVIT